MSPLGSAAGQLLEQGVALIVGQPFGGTQQPAPVDPFRVALVPAASAVGLGDAAANPIDHVVGFLDQMEAIHDQLGVRNASRAALA